MKSATGARRAIIQQGPCGICGGPYAAHRTIETQMEMVAAGDPIEQIAADYETNVTEMVNTWHAFVTLLLDAQTPETLA